MEKLCQVDSIKKKFSIVNFRNLFTVLQFTICHKDILLKANIIGIVLVETNWAYIVVDASPEHIQFLNQIVAQSKGIPLLVLTVKHEDGAVKVKSHRNISWVDPHCQLSRHQKSQHIQIDVSIIGGYFQKGIQSLLARSDATIGGSF